MNTVPLPDKARHDRYLIYHMLGREVSISHLTDKRRKKPITGVVHSVVRDIFERQVQFTIDRKVLRFKEPVLVVEHSDDILFIYGDTTPELSDEELFARMRSGEDFGMALNEVISRTRPDVVRLVKFTVGERVVRRGRTWRKQAR